MTISRYTTENGRGVASNVDTDDYQVALSYAQTARHRVIENRYEFSDSELVDGADFIDWHWHTATTDPRTTDEVTACGDSELGARDDLLDVLEYLRDQMPDCETNPVGECGTCVACQRRDETTAAIAHVRTLTDLDETTTVTLTIGLPAPVTYTITKVLGDDCDLPNTEAS